MLIPTLGILPFDGPHSEIPDGYQRYTGLDNGKYAMMWGTRSVGATGGNATHSHTSPNHVHTMESHGHRVITGQDYNASWVSSANGSSACKGHYHDQTVYGVSGGTLTDSCSYASTQNDPPYYEVIFIQATRPSLVPAKAMLFTQFTNSIPGFAEMDGNGGNTDIRGKYLRGASTGADAGGLGGTLNHEHAINHTPPQVSHSHSTTLGTTVNNGGVADFGTGDGSPKAGLNHPHTLTLGSVTEQPNDYVGNAGSQDSVEPEYIKLRILKNSSGAPKPFLTNRVMILFPSSSELPIGWSLCDGGELQNTEGQYTLDVRNKMIKIASSGAEIGDTGGSNTHGHTASNAHGHSATSTHTHSSGNSIARFTSVAGGSPSGTSAIAQHDHNISSVGTAQTTWASATVEADETTGEEAVPPYLTLAMIEFEFAVGGGGALLQAT